ncbi:MAG: hypothetical protein LUP99_01865 [Methanomicrobiales archaeon]|nr:hypothetical protein [Methanomicrobiales archaeon]
MNHRKNAIFLTSFFVIIVLISGCTSSKVPQPSPSPKTSVLTPVETTVLISTSTPITPTVTENITAQQSLIDANWREIQNQWDIFIEKRTRLFAGTLTKDITDYRLIIVPEAIINFNTIKSQLANIKSSDAKIIKERDDLTTICNYEIYKIEASSAGYHGDQMASIDRDTAIEEYRNAKYETQNALGIMNSFDEDSPYYPYIERDYSELNYNIDSYDLKLTKLSS